MSISKDRFALVGKYALRLNNKDGKVKAFATITDTEIGIEFRDVRLIEGSNGYFVGAPFREYEKDGKKEYADYWRPAYDVDAKAKDERGVEYVEAMTEALVAAYEQAKGAQGGSRGESRGSSRSSGSSAPARSGRGPVRAPTVSDDAPESTSRTSGGKKDLPF